MKLLQLPRPQPDAALIADLRELLAMAEAGDLEYIAYVAIQTDGEVMQWEVGTRDEYRVSGLLHELASLILDSDEPE